MTHIDPNTVTPYRLVGVELATAIVFGRIPDLPALTVGPAEPTPRYVLESLLLQALQKPPCVIGFSGGRDSSALLALAAHLARRESLPAPIAATNVFPGDVQAAEAEWQEMLISHAQVDEWQRLQFTAAMDVVGPIAAPLLRRFGPTFPFNGHFGMPSMELARGGTYLTGVGGDELFGISEKNRLARLLLRRTSPRRSDLLLCARLMAPRPLQVRRWQRIIPPEPWLQPATAAAFSRAAAASIASERLWFSDQVCDDVWRDKARRALHATLATFAATLDVELVQPFQDAALLRAVAAHAGRAGWSSRAAAMADIFGDILPPAVVNRNTKAGFDTVFFHDHSREFAKEWDGTGVDTALVNVQKLRAVWLADAVDARSLSLLQAAWYHQHGEHPLVKTS